MYAVGDTVRVKSGPYANLMATVINVYDDTVWHSDRAVTVYVLDFFCAQEQQDRDRHWYYNVPVYDYELH